jgi:hypothetical protein
MFTSIALVAALALSPAQAAKEIKYDNVKSLYGFHGPLRTSQKFLPGDQLYVAFDMVGVTIAKDGIATYTMAMDVTDAAGKSWQKVEARETTDYAPLGGNTLPGRAYVVMGVDMPPGEYTMKLNTTDKATGAKGTLTYKFEVLKKDLGIVGVYASHDPEGRNHAHTTGFAGTGLWLQFGITGFARDEKKKNQPSLKIELTYFDENGKPTTTEPMTEEFNALAEEAPILSIRKNLPFSRVGKFKAKLTVTDNVSKKTTSFELPINVLPTEK